MKLYEKALAASAGTAGAGFIAMKTMFPWIKYDFQLMKIGKHLVTYRDKAMDSLLVDKFELHADNQPNKPFIIFEDCVYTYKFVEDMANRVANWAKSYGLKHGDTVAMMIQNDPAFAWTFLGLQKVGVTVALINFNLRKHPLVHCVTVAEPKALIVGADEGLLEAVVDILPDLGNLTVLMHGEFPSLPAGILSFNALIASSLPVRVCRTYRERVTLLDTCCYIYTSGTTGNPKPAIINQMKAVGLACVMQVLYLSPDDVVYTALPLYHSSGGGIGLFGVIEKGATIVLRKKFSASHFWEDCCKHNVTVIQYIGELFRYLLGQPKSRFDTQHKVRVALGNGLRKDIWTQVASRYRIPHIMEFFGATEGTTLLVNLANKPGAIGRMSPFLKMLDPDNKILVKFDYVTAQPIRGKDGFCIPVKAGEPGLFITSVPDAYKKDGEYVAYRSSKSANEKKVIRNAFKKGDLYFNFGDVFVLDNEYFVYFHDRIGDTFRWKGENVSTTELANAVSTLDFIHDANVYGVTVPGHDGRAGMIALTLNDGYKMTMKELKKLYDFVCEELPSYARPLFIRHLTEAVITGTFKQQKAQLVKEAFDLNTISDPLYYLDNTKKTYSPLTMPELTSFLSSKL